MTIPDPVEASGLLDRLGVPAAEREMILAERLAGPERDIVESYARVLVEKIGTFDELPSWPSRDDFLYVWVFLAALPAVREFHVARRVPDDVSWASLADLGRAIKETRWRTGRAGFGHVWWLRLHFRGSLYRLVRLQFALEQDAVSVHIPRDGGRLTPDTCDRSFARAREFFARHFPDAASDTARCTSWLLDPQLAAYLAADSNIVRFGERFALTDELLPGDDDVMRFVFGERGVALEALPQTTTLERAVVCHLKAGRHWHTRRGTVPL